MLFLTNTGKDVFARRSKENKDPVTGGVTGSFGFSEKDQPKSSAMERVSKPSSQTISAVMDCSWR